MKTDAKKKTCFFMNKLLNEEYFIIYVIISISWIYYSFSAC